MNIILFAKCHNKPLAFRLTHPGCYLTLAAAFLLLAGGFFAAGFWAGQPGEAQVVPAQIVENWKQEIEKQKQLVQETRRKAQANIDALSLRLGRLQAHVIRVDALGQRLTEMAKLDKGEFDFNQPPAQGGPASSLDMQSVKVKDILRSMDELTKQINDRSQQLSVLESMILHSNLQKEVLPAGRPVKSGWLSSYYGVRNDPFTGKKAHHDGVDFAGKMGSDVIAVAAGVVTWSGKRYGYGNMVEVDHGNGLVTRYAHNKKNRVQVGDKIEKGQVVANMGSSGRSTGPHVHFEVLKNGRVVNPLKYIQAAN
jgi:murein DD-endopeptidase MepM/ murein hydrolase activator NlpD